MCVLCQNVVEGRAQLPWKNPPEDTIIFEEATQIRTAISPHVFYKREKCISVMVQRLAYLAFTEEAGVRLPVTEKFFVYFFFCLHFPISKPPLHANITNSLYVNFANTGPAGRTQKEQPLTAETCLLCHGSRGFTEVIRSNRRDVTMTR